MAIDNLPETAPDFTLDHVLGQPVSLADYRGRRLVVVFGGRESAGQIKSGISQIRRTYDPDEVTIIGISDLRSAPRPARILVKSQLKKAFEEAVRDQAADLAAAGKPPREHPEQDVLMLMDWSGEVVDRYGVSGADKEAAAVAVDPDGRIVGSGSGPQLGDQILSALSAG